ncbi:hypothetical protein B0T25DRAFT_566398 [Lasiosphaeria hispida]|uniref:Uncharacterized protein n=1 Tax=Lasiosphaeria hispida TaxID=260671 RepID=A0AAJ0HM21_9PEZI|nr:hypothetical protein B0T25DRAFT_566398 [Lasiosphaeria hispida]
MTYDEIAFCVPGSWGKPFQDQLRPLIKEAFPRQDMNQVYFLSESIALAHYTISNELHQLSNWSLVLFLDFGGHSMSFSLFLIERQNSGTLPSFVEVDSGSAAGGSSMWEHHISDLIAGKLKVPDPDGTILLALKKQFCREKVDISQRILDGDRRTKYLYYLMEGSLIGNNNMVFVNLSYEEILVCFNRGLHEPIQLAKKKLRELAQYATSESIGVVVAGGSMRTEHAKAAVFGDSPIPEDRIQHAKRIGWSYMSMCNARGAANSLTNKTTVMQFIENGAAIGVQKRTNSLLGGEWENAAYIALHKAGSEEHELRSHGLKFYSRQHGDLELKIVIDHAYIRRGQPDQARIGSAGRPGAPTTPCGMLKIEHCYDLYHLGPLKAGTITLDVSLRNNYGLDGWTSSGAERDQLYLCVTTSRLHGCMKAPEVQEIDLPLYFDPGQNCIHVDLEAMHEGAWEEQQQRRAAIHPPSNILATMENEEPGQALPTPHVSSEANNDDDSDDMGDMPGNIDIDNEDIDPDYCPTNDPNQDDGVGWWQSRPRRRRFGLDEGDPERERPPSRRRQTSNTNGLGGRVQVNPESLGYQMYNVRNSRHP